MEPKVGWMGNGRRVSGFSPNTHSSRSLSHSTHNPGVTTAVLCELGSLETGSPGSMEWFAR
jgi:hypothetical protein